MGQSCGVRPSQALAGASPAHKAEGIRCLQNYRAVNLNRGFRWARAAWRWVHLTRDDHAPQAMYQARAQLALVQGNIKPDRIADGAILASLQGRGLEYN